MSYLLDQAACKDAKRREDLAREDAKLLATMFPLCRATGNHRVAQNDEPEPTDADFLAADLLRDTDKGPRLARQNDARAFDLQMVDLDAVRRAGL